MSRFRRLVVAIGAPLVVVVGLGVIWGVRTASVLKAQIEAWADSLEHSPNPVTMELSFLPAYVDGDRVGRLNAIVVQRHQPATVDSVRIEIGTSGDFHANHFEDCAIQFDPDAFDRKGPLGFKHALTCVRDTGDLVEFGSVLLSGLDHELALFLEAQDLPCNHMAEGDERSCRKVREDIDRLREEIRNEVRVNLKRDIRARF